MVRRSGSNIPQSGIMPPELYQNAGENYARVRQNAMSNFEAARQATSGVVQANAANTQADLSRLREMEDFRAAQIQASSRSKSSALGGIGELIQGVVGGIAAQQELKAKQEEMMYERQLKERQMSLQENKFAYEVAEDQQADQLKAYEGQLKLMEEHLGAAVGDLEFKVREQVRNVSMQDGISYARTQFDVLEKEYSGLFKMYPELAAKYRTLKNSAFNKLWDETQTKWDEQYTLEANTSAEGKITEFTATFAPNIAQIKYLQDPEEAQAYTVDIINQAVQLAQNDENFMQIVGRNPQAWNQYMSGVTSRVLKAYEDYATTNAAAQAEASRIRQFTEMFDGQDFTDPVVINAASEWLAANGMPQSLVYNPSSFPSTNIQVSKEKVEYLNNLEKLAAAERSNDPIFASGTPEHETMFRVNSANILYDVLNHKKDRNYIENFIKEKADEAERYGSSDITYWNGLLDRFKQWDKDSLAYTNLKQEYNREAQKYSQMVGAASEVDTVVITDPLSNDPARRVLVTSDLPKQPKYSEFDIQKQEAIVKDIEGQMTKLQRDWAYYGININDTTDPSLVNELNRQARPLKEAIEKRLQQSGNRVDNEGYVYSNPENEKPSSKPPVKSGVPASPQSRVPANFTGGKEDNDNVLRGMRGQPTLPTNKAQNTPSIPLSRNLAVLEGVGWSPFQDGKPSLVQPEPMSQGKSITLTGGGSGVSTMQGGEVVWSGVAGEMGNTVLIKNGDGLTEVIYGLGSIGVRKGDYLKPAQSIGTSNGGKLNLEVWASTNPLNSLWKGEGRNQQDPLSYMQQFNATVPLERGVGTMDVDDFSSYRPTNGGMMYQNSDYIINNGYIFNRKNGKTRKLTVDEFSEFYPNGIERPKVVDSRGYSVGFDETLDVKPMEDEPFKYKSRKGNASWVNQKPNKKGVPKKFVFAAGHHNIYRGKVGGGAPKEFGFTPVVTEAIVKEGLRRGYEVKYLKPEYTSKKGLSSVLDELKSYQNQGYGVLEIHGDAANETGKSGVILGDINNYSELEYLLAQEFGGYDYDMHNRGGINPLYSRKIGLPLLEVGSMSLFQDESKWDEASKEIARRYWDAVEGKFSESSDGGYMSPNDMSSWSGYKPEVKATQSRMIGNRSGLSRGVSGVIADAQSNTRLVADTSLPPEVAAFLDTITYAEGTAGELGYQAAYAYTNHFNSGKWTPHPNKKVNAGGHNSEATGRYQFMYPTWVGHWGGKNQEMNPIAQDQAAVKEMKAHGAYDPLMKGDIKKALYEASSSWVSIKTAKSAKHGQGLASVDLLEAYYKERLKLYKNRQKPRNKNPRTFTDKPLKPSYSSGKLYTYKDSVPKANANFGHRQLADNEYVRKSIYSAAVKTGVPQQWIADLYVVNPSRFNNKRLESDIVKLVADYRRRGRINTIEDAAQALLGKSDDKTMQMVGKNAGRQYQLSAYSVGSWHLNPRSTCPTCQSMSRSGRFVPHKH